MRRTLAMLAAIMLPFVAMSASYTNSFVRNGVTYVQRGGLTIKDYVVTNVMSSGSTGITTNDVCNIVTNTVSTGWIFPDVFDGFLYAPSEAWMRAEGDVSSSYYIPSNLRRVSGKWVVSVMFWDGDGEEFVVNDGYDFESSESANATTIHLGSPYTSEVLVASRSYNNALGLARLSDLPQNTPVDELLFNGSDGKVYHLRIGSGGSIDIYTEVTP